VKSSASSSASLKKGNQIWKPILKFEDHFTNAPQAAAQLASLRKNRLPFAVRSSVMASFRKTVWFRVVA